MTFSPMPLVSLLPALLIMSIIRFTNFKRDRLKIFLFNVTLLILVIPVGLLLRRNTGYGGMSFEIKWMSHDPWWFVLLNLGPMLLFFPFGLRDYMKNNNFLKQILLIFSLVSYGLFISPVAYYLGTHNLRFFSSISYICYGVITVLGIKKIASLFKNRNKIVIMLLSSLLIFYSSFLTFYSLNKRLSGLDPTTPETFWTYLPSPIIEGLQSLRDYPQVNVLTGPYGGIGMFVPIFSYRRVYVGHPTGTPNIERKRAISNLFYTGKMKENDAKNFLKTNNLAYVVLTSLDNYDEKNISNYRFLKLIFVEKYIKIWKSI